MPLLDVSDVLLDPDFMDTSLVCHRQVQTVDEDNFTKTQHKISQSLAWRLLIVLGKPGEGGRPEHQRRDPHRDAVQINPGPARYRQRPAT